MQQDSHLRAPHDLTNRPVRHVDRGVGVRAARRVGIGNRDPSEPPAADDAGAVLGRRERPLHRIPQGVGVVGIPVRPPVHGDPRDVPRRVEPAAAQRARQLRPDFALTTVVASLLVIGLVATLIPSWRATRIDPIEILRRE